MRIGLSTSPIQRGQTGVAQHLFSLLRAFIPFTQEHQFFLFTLADDLPLLEFTQPHMQLVSISELARHPLRNILWHQLDLPRLAHSLKLDLIHIPSYRRLLYTKPCPLIGTIHDLAPFHVARKYDSLRMFYGKVVVRLLAKRQNAIIAISQNTARDIQHFFRIPARYITVIYNGLDHHQFFPAPDPTPKTEFARRFNVHAPFFLYVARLEHPAKNHLRLIQAFNQFKNDTHSNWALVLAGANWQHAHVIHNAILHTPFQSQIHCLGFVPQSDLPLLYRAADAFVFPSLYEGFGLPPLEAMACGCPVLSSNRGALAEVIGHAALPLDPENVQQMALQLTKVASNPALRLELRQAGLAQAQCFNWTHAATQTLQLYQKVMTQPQQGMVGQPRPFSS